VAEKFVEHALRLCPVVIMLLPLSWLESQRRAHLLESGLLARVHVFARRLPMLHRHGHAARKTSNMRAYAWFVWDRAHQGGAPTVHRISWR
jgi:hypothetical protein